MRIWKREDLNHMEHSPSSFRSMTGARLQDRTNSETLFREWMAWNIEDPSEEDYVFQKWPRYLPPRLLFLQCMRCDFFNRLFYFFIFIFWLRCAACGIIVPWPGIEPGPSAVRARSPNHWTTREFPNRLYFFRAVWGLQKNLTEFSGSPHTLNPSKDLARAPTMCSHGHVLCKVCKNKIFNLNWSIPLLFPLSFPLSYFPSCRVVLEWPQVSQDTIEGELVIHVAWV